MIINMKLVERAGRVTLLLCIFHAKVESGEVGFSEAGLSGGYSQKDPAEF